MLVIVLWCAPRSRVRGTMPASQTHPCSVRSEACARSASTCH